MSKVGGLILAESVDADITSRPAYFAVKLRTFVRLAWIPFEVEVPGLMVIFCVFMRVVLLVRLRYD